MEKSHLYKLVIPANVEQKIRTLCSNINTIEWSGILFYTLEGSFEDGSLVATCKDLYLMDIGNGTYTEFEISPELAHYNVINPELIHCRRALVHSHHSMMAFFSNTDINTLMDQGEKKEIFLSLIVNNAGNYVAKITHKLHCKVHSERSYTDVNGKLITVEPTEEDTVEVIPSDLEIIKEEYTLDPLMDRINVIRNRKAEATKATKVVIPSTKSTKKSKKEKEEERDVNLFTLYDKLNIGTPKYKETDFNYEGTEFSPYPTFDSRIGDYEDYDYYDNEDFMFNKYGWQ